MIKKVFYISFFISPVLLGAQSLQLRFSDVEKSGFREIHDQVVGFTGKGYDIIRTKYNAFGEATVFVDHFDQNSLMRKYSVEVFKRDLYRNGTIKHKTEFAKTIMVDTTLLVLFTCFNADKLENELYAVTIVDGDQIGNPKKILSTKCPNRFEKGEFIIEYDIGQKSFTVIGVERDARTDDQVLEVCVFDQGANLLWNQRLNVPYKEGRYELVQIELDESNRLFLLFKIILNKDQQKQKNLPNADYYFSLLQLSNAQDEDYLETILKIEDKIVYNMWIDVIKIPSKILLTGLYYDKKSDLNPKGVYFTSFEKDSTNLASIKIQSIGDDFIPDFETESPFTEITDAEPVVELVDLIQSGDGGYYLLGEYVLINETCAPDYRSALMSCNYNYYFNDIFVFKFDSTGSLQRKIRIPKKQFTRNDNAIHSSFAYGMIQNNLVLFYNDHPKNLKPKNPASISFMTDAKKSNLAAVTIDQKGIVNKEFIINNDKRKAWCKPRIFFKSEAGIILFSEKGKMFQSILIQ